MTGVVIVLAIWAVLHGIAFHIARTQRKNGGHNVTRPPRI
jgi:hypothetical protein